LRHDIIHTSIDVLDRGDSSSYSDRTIVLFLLLSGVAVTASLSTKIGSRVLKNCTLVERLWTGKLDVQDSQ
jgi:hypothetical protein